MREDRDNITGDDVVVGGGSPSHGRWTAPQACYVREMKDGVKKGRGGRERVSEMRGKRRPVFQNTQPEMPRAGPKWSPREGGGL